MPRDSRRRVRPGHVALVEHLLYEVGVVRAPEDGVQEDVHAGKRAGGDGRAVTLDVLELFPGFHRHGDVLSHAGGLVTGLTRVFQLLDSEGDAVEVVRDAVVHAPRHVVHQQALRFTPPGVEMNLSRSAGSGEDVSHVRHEARDDEANLRQMALGQSRPAICTPIPIAMRLIIGHEERLDVPETRQGHLASPESLIEGVCEGEDNGEGDESPADVHRQSLAFHLVYGEEEGRGDGKDAEEPRFHGDEVLEVDAYRRGNIHDGLVQGVEHRFGLLAPASPLLEQRRFPSPHVVYFVEEFGDCQALAGAHGAPGGDGVRTIRDAPHALLSRIPELRHDFIRARRRHREACARAV